MGATTNPRKTWASKLSVTRMDGMEATHARYIHVLNRQRRSLKSMHVISNIRLGMHAVFKPGFHFLLVGAFSFVLAISYIFVIRFLKSRYLLVNILVKSMTSIYAGENNIFLSVLLESERWSSKKKRASNARLH